MHMIKLASSAKEINNYLSSCIKEMDWEKFAKKISQFGDSFFLTLNSFWESAAKSINEVSLYSDDCAFLNPTKIEDDIMIYEATYAEKNTNK